MQIAQYLDSILHMFEKNYQTKALKEYAIPFGTGEKAKTPKKLPGKVPLSEGEWWPHPLTKAEVESGIKSIKLGQAEMAARGLKRK
jgi:hypothetical protein